MTVFIKTPNAAGHVHMHMHTRQPSNIASSGGRTWRNLAQRLEPGLTHPHHILVCQQGQTPSRVLLKLFSVLPRACQRRSGVLGNPCSPLLLPGPLQRCWAFPACLVSFRFTCGDRVSGSWGHITRSAIGRSLTNSKHKSGNPKKKQVRSKPAGNAPHLSAMDIGLGGGAYCMKERSSLR